MNDPAPDIPTKRIRSHPVQGTGRCQAVRGIDAEQAETADQVSRYRHPDEHHHDEEADGAEYVALRKEGQPAPAMCRMGARALQYAIVIDHGQTGSPSPYSECADRSRRKACRR